MHLDQTWGQIRLYLTPCLDTTTYAYVEITSCTQGWGQLKNNWNDQFQINLGIGAGTSFFLTK